jgi:hypothetical protein
MRRRLQRCPFDDTEQRLSDTMMEYWASFAMTGRPSSVNPRAPVWAQYMQTGTEKTDTNGAPGGAKTGEEAAGGDAKTGEEAAVETHTIQFEAGATAGGIKMITGYKNADCAFWRAMHDRAMHGRAVND